MNDILSRYSSLVADVREHIVQGLDLSSSKAVDEGIYARFKDVAIPRASSVSPSPSYRRAPKPPVTVAVEPDIRHRKEKAPVVKESTSIEGFALEKSKNSESLDRPDVKGLFSGILPDGEFLEAVPDDSAAKKRHAPAVPAVVVVFRGGSSDDHDFLGKVTKAINDTIIPAVLFSYDQIEALWGWKAFLSEPSLRYIVACNSLVKDNLGDYYHGSKGDAIPTLGSASFVGLEKISRYHNNTALKSTLWKTLQSVLVGEK